MKYFKSTLTLFLFFACSLAANAQNGCVSFSSIVMSEFEEEFKTEIADILTEDDAPANNQPSSVKKPRRIRNVNYNKNYVRTGNKLIKKPLGGNQSGQVTKQDNMEDLIDRIDEFWEDNLGSGSLSVGPRALRIPDAGQVGNLTALIGTERTFLTVPVLDHETVTVTIQKTDGKQKGSAYVCRAHYEDPNHWERVGEVSFGKGNSTETVTVNNAKGYHIAVRVTKKWGGHNFHYKVSTEGS